MERVVGAMIKKRIARCLCIMLLLVLAVGILGVSAEPGAFNWDTAYSYTYDVHDKSVQAPAIYTVTGESEPGFSGATDLFVHGDNLYVLDAAHARIVQLDASTLSMQAEIQSTEIDLADAKGLFITANGEMYVSLYTKKQVAVLDAQGQLLKLIDEPKSEAIPADFVYKPTRLVVQEDSQSGERLLYVVSEGAYDGLIQMDDKGNFISFFGSNTVTLSITQVLQQFWNKLVTEAMKDRTQLSLPANYSSVAISEDGFIYVCTDSGDVVTNQLKRLSPYGANITNVTGGDAYGDLESARVDGVLTASALIDLTVDENGTISALDGATGRIFQYDEESYLLGVFGGIGAQAGLFQKPVAIANIGTELFVLDGQLGVVYAYEPTEYGNLIHTAQRLADEGNEAEAVPVLQEIDRRCSGLKWVNRNLGKAALIQGDYIAGMQYFKTALDVNNYSECYEMYRSVLMEKYFWILFVGVITVLAAIWIMINRSLKKEPTTVISLSNKKITPFHLLAHPTAFGDMKEENRGSLWMACGVLVLTMVARVLSISSTSFIFRPEGDATVNYPLEMLQIVLLFLCFVGCSWAVGTFLEGKGKIKELFTASAYALLPYCLCLLLSIGLSNVLCLREAAFVTGLEVIGLYWSAMLIFLAMMRTNQYSFGKTVVSLLLTVVAIIFVLFILIMMFTLVTKITDFVGQVVEEYQFRFL